LSYSHRVLAIITTRTECRAWRLAQRLSYYAPDPSGLASLKMTVALEISRE